MEQNVANSNLEEGLSHLRLAGLRMLGWPLLALGGAIYHYLFLKGEFMLSIDPAVIVLAFFSYQLMNRNQRYLHKALIAYWFLLIAGTVFIFLGLCFPDLGVQMTAFIVLFKISPKNALLAFMLNLINSGWPILELLRAQKRFRIHQTMPIPTLE